MEYKISCNALSKHYGGIKALDGLDLSLTLDQATGIVGPNGAGKSTLFSILCGLIKPSSGKVSIFGETVNSAPNKGRLSLLPQDTAMYKGIEVLSQLHHYARLQGLQKKAAFSEVERVLNQVNAHDFAKQFPETLSFGQRKRVMLAQSLIGNPEIILMDEPTSGLDPVAAAEVRRILQQLSLENSILISSHNLSEIETICRDIVILDKGKLVTHCNLSELTRTTQCISLRLEEANNNTQIIELIRNIDGIRHIENDGNDNRTYLIHYEEHSAEEAQIRILTRLGEQGIGVAELKKGKALANEVAEIIKSNN